MMMKKLYFSFVIALLGLCSCTIVGSGSSMTEDSSGSNNEEKEMPVFSDQHYRGFSMDNVLHSEKLGDIHYNVYVPDDYDGSSAYALYFTLPGYQGLYRFGVGANLETENFAFEAIDYIDDIIIVAPQLNDWSETSARQTIELVHWFLDNLNIDEDRVFANGYSGGGETMSTTMGIEPTLFTRYLHCSSRWDGDLEALVESETPVYLVIGENDEYYGSKSTIETYNDIVELYRAEGLTEEKISSLVVLDVKNRDYFASQGMSNEHGGGGKLFASDPEIMGWLFGTSKMTIR